MEQREKSLEQRLKDWAEGNASLEEITRLPRKVGRQHYTDGIPVLIQLLDHEDPIVRYNAVMALGYDFHYRPATDKLLGLLVRDEDVDARSVAAGALNTLWQGTKEPRILEALAHSALNDPDEDVRESAYMALLFVHGLPPEEQLRLLTNGKPLPVDEARVNEILAGSH